VIRIDLTQNHETSQIKLSSPIKMSIVHNVSRTDKSKGTVKNHPNIEKEIQDETVNEFNNMKVKTSDIALNPSSELESISKATPTNQRKAPLKSEDNNITNNATSNVTHNNESNITLNNTSNILLTVDKSKIIKDNLDKSKMYHTDSEKECFNENTIAEKASIVRKRVRNILNRREGHFLSADICYIVCIRFLASCFCSSTFKSCQRNKESTYIFSLINNYLNRSMEVTNLMKNYWDIELMKFLLLDFKQYDAYRKISFLNGLEIMQIDKDKEMRTDIVTKRKSFKVMDNQLEKIIRNYSLDEKLLALTKTELKSSNVEEK